VILITVSILLEEIEGNIVHICIPKYLLIWNEYMRIPHPQRKQQNLAQPYVSLILFSYTYLPLPLLIMYDMMAAVGTDSYMALFSSGIRSTFIFSLVNPVSI
jgi:hypothetical protein